MPVPKLICKESRRGLQNGPPKTPDGSCSERPGKGCLSCMISAAGGSFRRKLTLKRLGFSDNLKPTQRGAIMDQKLKQAREFLREYNFSRALAAYEKLTKSRPNSARVWIEYGCAAEGATQADLADKAWAKALELEPRSSSLLREVGMYYQKRHFPAKARDLYQRAIAADPRAIDPRISLAALHEMGNDLSEARETANSCLAIDPRDEQARYWLAVLDRRENKLEEAERALRDLAATARHPFVRYSCRYELAEVLDRTGRFDEAIKTLAEAKNIVAAGQSIDRLLKNYDGFEQKYRRKTEALPTDIPRVWAKEFPEKTRAPIPRLAYLGGHPRSGTTLLEQVLGAHPEMAVLDEPTAFALVVVQLFNASPQLSPARLNVIRRRYIDRQQSELGGASGNQFILDKNPIDLMKLCIWLRVFPELRVIVALRDPRDVVVSCYFQNLELNAFSANFLSLERTARHYANLMDIWLAARRWEGFAWLESRYEDLVADMETEGRRVTQFLGLQWAAGQARFYEKSRSKQIYAPTHRDARQPIYRRAVARWRNYEKHLQPCLAVLAPYCRAFGYDPS